MKDYTAEFLRSIAERLSSRQSCRKIEYDVFIGVSPNVFGRQFSMSELDPSNKVFFYPERTVYPDTHHRQRTDLQNVVNHVMRTKFKDTVYDHDDEYGQACFKADSLTPGEYKYILSFDKKRRQWVKVTTSESL